MLQVFFGIQLGLLFQPHMILRPSSQLDHQSMRQLCCNYLGLLVFQGKGESFLELCVLFCVFFAQEHHKHRKFKLGFQQSIQLDGFFRIMHQSRH